MARYCNHCGHEVEDELVLTEYPYYCPNCDENLFEIETHEGDNGEPAKKSFEVDIRWVVEKTLSVKAATKEEAVKRVMEIVDRGDVDVWTDGFTATDDVKVSCDGETPPPDTI